MKLFRVGLCVGRPWLFEMGIRDKLARLANRCLTRNRHVLQVWEIPGEPPIFQKVGKLSDLQYVSMRPFGANVDFSGYVSLLHPDGSFLCSRSYHGGKVTSTQACAVDFGPEAIAPIDHNAIEKGY